MAKTKKTAINTNGANGDQPDAAYITPALVTWALKRSRLSIEQVADKLNVDASLLEGWQKPNGPHPTFDKAMALAKLLHVPFGFFYLSKPPESDLPLPDFRGFNRSYKPSADLLELLNDILVKQDWFRDHEKELGRSSLKFVGSYTASDDIEKVAEAIRTRLDITVAARHAASSWTEYMSVLTRRCENVGILVMRSGVVGNLTNRKLETKELLGFAVADPFAPIVFVNSSDFKASQVFTLAHELAHIWIGQSAIANPDETGEADTNRIESFCNKVAAEVLVPRKEFLNEWRGITSSADVRLARTSRRFWVSGYVIARRAHELQQISDDDFQRLKGYAGKLRKKEESKGGNYYKNLTIRMGQRLTDAVLGDLSSGKLELRDAAGLLSVKVPTLLKFAERAK